MAGWKKIVLALIAAALVGLYFVSPAFQRLLRRGYDEAQNARYRVGQSSGQSEPTLDDAQRDALALECRNRMTAMEGAKRALLQRTGVVQPGSSVTVGDIAERLGSRVETLVCPQTGAAYRLGNIADHVACDVGGNGTPSRQADDHRIEM